MINRVSEHFSWLALPVYKPYSLKNKDRHFYIVGAEFNTPGSIIPIGELESSLINDIKSLDMASRICEYPLKYHFLLRFEDVVIRNQKKLCSDIYNNRKTIHSHIKESLSPEQISVISCIANSKQVRFSFDPFEIIPTCKPRYLLHYLKNLETRSSFLEKRIWDFFSDEMKVRIHQWSDNEFTINNIKTEVLTELNLIIDSGKFYTEKIFSDCYTNELITDEVKVLKPFYAPNRSETYQKLNRLLIEKVFDNYFTRYTNKVTTAIQTGFNRVIKNDRFFTMVLLNGIVIDERLQNLLDKYRSGLDETDMRALNRLILEAHFPDIIKRLFGYFDFCDKYGLPGSAVGENSNLPEGISYNNWMVDSEILDTNKRKELISSHALVSLVEILPLRTPIFALMVYSLNNYEGEVIKKRDELSKRWREFRKLFDSHIKPLNSSNYLFSAIDNFESKKEKIGESVITPVFCNPVFAMEVDRFNELMDIIKNAVKEFENIKVETEKREVVQKSKLEKARSINSLLDSVKLNIDLFDTDQNYKAVFTRYKYSSLSQVFGLILFKQLTEKGTIKKCELDECGRWFNFIRNTRRFCPSPSGNRKSDCERRYLSKTKQGKKL